MKKNKIKAQTTCPRYEKKAGFKQFFKPHTGVGFHFV